MLLATDDMRIIIWHFVAECGNLQALQKLSDQAKEKLKTEEIKYKL